MTKYSEFIIKDLGIEGKSSMMQTIIKMMFAMTVYEESCEFNDGRVESEFVQELKKAGFVTSNHYLVAQSDATKMVLGEETDSFEFKIAALTEHWPNDLNWIVSAELGVEDTWALLGDAFIKCLDEIGASTIVADVQEARAELTRIAEGYAETSKMRSFN